MVLQTQYQNMNVGNEEALKAMIVLHSNQFNIECRCVFYYRVVYHYMLLRFPWNS